MQGSCKFFETSKGYGFIGTEAGDFFFHQGDISGRPPLRGDQVEFWLADDPRVPGKLRAVEVQVAEKPNVARP